MAEFDDFLSILKEEIPKLAGTHAGEIKEIALKRRGKICRRYQIRP